MSVCVCPRSCVCLYAVLTGGESCAGKVHRRVIMHNLWRVHTGALWVFLFALAISFSFLFFPVVHINEILNVPQWPMLDLKKHSSAY